MTRKSESIVRQHYEEKGYIMIRAGAPDFIALKDGEVEFIEVKSEGDKLSDIQKRAFEQLIEHGQTVSVVSPNGYYEVELIPRTVRKDRPRFITSREYEYILALEKHKGDRGAAAAALGVQENAVEKTLTRIRKKVTSAHSFRRKYGKLIERRR